MHAPATKPNFVVACMIHMVSGALTGLAEKDFCHQYPGEEGQIADDANEVLFLRVRNGSLVDMASQTVVHIRATMDELYLADSTWIAEAVVTGQSQNPLVHHSSLQQEASRLEIDQRSLAQFVVALIVLGCVSTYFVVEVDRLVGRNFVADCFRLESLDAYTSDD